MYYSFFLFVETVETYSSGKLSCNHSMCHNSEVFQVEFRTLELDDCLTGKSKFVLQEKSKFCEFQNSIWDGILVRS